MEIELKKHVQEMEIELPGDLKDIPNKLETFTSTVSSITSQVAELKTLQWKVPTEFLGIPSQVSSVQEKLKTLDALLSLLNKITDTLNKFANILETASSKATDKRELIKKDKGKEATSSKDAEEEKTESDYEDHANPTDSMVETSKQKKLKKFGFVTKGSKEIHLTAEKIEEQKRIEESLKAELAKQEVEKVKNELVDLMGTDVVTQYYNKKLLYDKYCDKMLKRRKSSKITNCYVLTKKGPITLKDYREDETNEVISNFKIKTRINYLNQNEKELRVDFSRPLKEQDPLDGLNDLANKKIKRTGDFKDHSKSIKKHKSLVQHEDEVLLDSLKKVQLQFFRYLEYQDHLHFILCGGTETEDKTLARASVQHG
ncbi:hypothetical protein Tco_1214263 [Tanacetum coccineum]